MYSNLIISIVITVVTILLMISSILFFPSIKTKKSSLSLYPIITLVGAILLLILNIVSLSDLKTYILSDSAINPLKILVLFISMTILSINLDELGFFKYVALKTLKIAGNNQYKLFFALYATVSILTVFTSNDIIILSFTPFICYFAKHAKINPMPYLFTEFVAANTWSMLLVIGNPTNIYISQAFGINFTSYFIIMALPTLLTGIVSLFILLLIFNNKLKIRIEEIDVEEYSINDKSSLTVGLIILGTCTFVLAISSYIGIQMWLVSLIALIIYLIYSLVLGLIKKDNWTHLINTLKRGPYELIPFVLSMFILVIGLTNVGITDIIGNLLSNSHQVLYYGVSSFLISDIINNIPMSVLYSSIIDHSQASIGAIYASIAGSNIGAFLTPIGALAGIMWSSICKNQNVEVSYGKFVEYGALVSIPSILAAILGIIIIL